MKNIILKTKSYLIFDFLCSILRSRSRYFPQTTAPVGLLPRSYCLDRYHLGCHFRPLLLHQLSATASRAVLDVRSEEQPDKARSHSPAGGSGGSYGRRDHSNCRSANWSTCSPKFWRGRSWKERWVGWLNTLLCYTRRWVWRIDIIFNYLFLNKKSLV